MRWLMILFALLGLMIGWAFGDEPRGSRWPDPQVEVRLLSQRHFSAQVHPRTNDQHLWLRFGTPTLQVLRPIRWDRVRWVLWSAKRYPAGEFRRLVGEHPERFFPDVAEAKQAPVVPKVPEDRASSPGGPAPGVPLAHWAAWALGTSAPVSYLEAYARVLPAPAGQPGVRLMVVLVPKDAQGHDTPVVGTAEITLLGFRRDQGRWVPLARWTRRIGPQNHSPLGAVLHLSLRRKFREENPRLAPRGKLTVRLLVPGQGTFVQETIPVRLP